jgi:hypothetical protein
VILLCLFGRCDLLLLGKQRGFGFRDDCAKIQARIKGGAE